MRNPINNSEQTTAKGGDLVRCTCAQICRLTRSAQSSARKWVGQRLCRNGRIQIRSTAFPRRHKSAPALFSIDVDRSNPIPRPSTHTHTHTDTHARTHRVGFHWVSFHPLNELITHHENEECARFRKSGAQRFQFAPAREASWWLSDLYQIWQNSISPNTTLSWNLCICLRKKWIDNGI